MTTAGEPADNYAWLPESGVLACSECSSYLTFSPDGAHVALTQGAELRVFNIDGEERLRIDQFSHLPAWSPDGSRLADGEWPGTALLDPETGARTDLPDLHFLEWSPDGRYFLAEAASTTGAPGGRTLVFADRAGDVVAELFAYSGISRSAWTPDGTTLAIAVYSSHIPLD